MVTPTAAADIPETQGSHDQDPELLAERRKAAQSEIDGLEGRVRSATTQPEVEGGNAGEHEHKAVPREPIAAGGASAGPGGRKKDDGVRTTLPPEIQAQFGQVDLSDVTVIKQSKKAEERGVQGFATRDEIHVAPGVDEVAVMRHEAAHVVQMRKAQPHKRTDSKDDNERAARQAESGQPQTDVGTAPPDAVRNKDDEPATKELPDPVDFLGQSLSGVSGSKRIGDPEYKLFEFNPPLYAVSFPVLAILHFDVSIGLGVACYAGAWSDISWGVVRNEKNEPVYRVKVKPGLMFKFNGSIVFSLGAAISVGVAGASGRLWGLGQLKSDYKCEGEEMVTDVGTDGVSLQKAGSVGGGHVTSFANLNLSAGVKIWAGFETFKSFGWYWEWTKDWQLAKWRVNMPNIPVPKIPLGSPEAVASNQQDKLGDVKPGGDYKVPARNVAPGT